MAQIQQLITQPIPGCPVFKMGSVHFCTDLTGSTWTFEDDTASVVVPNQYGGDDFVLTATFDKTEEDGVTTIDNIAFSEGVSE